MAKIGLGVKPTITTTEQVKLQQKIDAYLDVKALIDRLQADLAETKEELKAAAYRAKRKGQSCETDTHQVAYIEAENVHISEEPLKLALLKLKVSPTVIARAIEAATQRTPYAYAKVSAKKGAGGGGKDTRRKA